MQTFLTQASFSQSLLDLDKKRLNKQRVEAHQLVSTIETGSKWKNHPVALMWADYLNALKVYANACNNISEFNGINHTAPHYVFIKEPLEYPSWFGNYHMLASHKGNLLRKNSSFYSNKFWHESPNMPYFWPVPIKCKKTGAKDPISKLWVKLNSPEQKAWFNAYSKSDGNIYHETVYPIGENKI